jgi:multidrug efflux pump subunit AcrA (membrane-fusion protein)
VPQYAAPGIKVGLPVEVTLKELPGRIFHGEVKRTSVALNASARTLRTEIHIPNRDLVLAPGMYADVKFDIPNAIHSFIVPATALVSRGEGQQLALVLGDKIHLQPVEVGHDLGNKVEIVSGITGKELLVANPSDTLIDGTKVKTADAAPVKKQF